MAIPRIVTRITNHAKPKYQFYFPGFNEGNSCWLDGGWVTVSKEEFDRDGAAHQAEWGDVRDLQRGQNHRDPGTPRDQMTPKQRRAWEQNSGTIYVEAEKDGHRQRIGLSTAAGEIDAASHRWMEKHGWTLVSE
tara:strand:+ start:148071 stop:148472 length:402 start_codon:yes stop_codon:yes gene_type:complete